MIDDVPTIDDTFLVGLKKPVFVGNGWVYAYQVWILQGMYV